MRLTAKQLLYLNLRFCGIVALICGIPLGFLVVLALGGSFPSASELPIFFSVGLAASAMFAFMFFLPTFFLSLTLQGCLIYFRRGRQENNSRMLEIAFGWGLIFLLIAMLALLANPVGGLIFLAIAGLWSLRTVNYWFRP